MRILMCSPNPLVRELGAPKVSIELAEALREIGVECEVVGPGDYGAAAAQDRAARADRWSRLRAYLQANASRFDVVEYDHEELPFPRADFDPRPLMVARCVLLVHRLATPVPRRWDARTLAGAVLHGWARRRLHDARVRSANRTLRESDLINVANDWDEDAMAELGLDPAKVTVLPYGLSRARRAAFEAMCGEGAPAEPRVAFVGTFDWRKGAADFPDIVRVVSLALSDVRFRLLGTAGLFRTAAQVLRFFPRAAWPRIEVHPRFAPGALPRLLADCSVGVFPSYYEGFGFGVLEMLAAALPVLAYRAAGPAMMLPPAWLVGPGRVGGVELGGRLLNLLGSPLRLAEARARARQRSRRFDWIDIAQRTVRAYEEAIARRDAAYR